MFFEHEIIVFTYMYIKLSLSLFGFVPTPSHSLQAVDAVVAALKDTDLNLNPIPEKTTIKVPIPK